VFSELASDVLALHRWNLQNPNLWRPNPLVMKQHSEPILLIHAAKSSESELITFFNLENKSWVGVNRFAEAAEEKQQRHFGLVVCDWELFRASQHDCAESECCKRLLLESAPVIFVSSNQTVAVNFKSLLGRSFYCVKATESPVLFDVIAELAAMVSVEVVTSNVGPKEVVPFQQRPFLPAPNFSLGESINPSMLNSSIHAFY
jgi:hypothetical protein